MATLAFIKTEQFVLTLGLCERFIHHEHHLIHKACGWMLREIYWRVDKHFVESFIVDHYNQMSRTTLRYAIERMPEPQRKQFLKGEFWCPAKENRFPTSRKNAG